MSLSRVVFLGPPGAGKGTHAIEIAQARGLAHLSTGDMLRAAVREGTETGKLAQTYMDRGELIPDDVMIDVIFDRLAKADGGGWILDGFPRTLPQAEALDRRLDERGEQLDGVILFEVPDEELVERLSARLTCSSCGAVFNRRTSPPQVDGVCDACGGELITRPDDQPEAVAKRLDVYAKSTEPLIGYYEAAGKLFRLDALGEISAIRGRIEALLDG